MTNMNPRQFLILGVSVLLLALPACGPRKLKPRVPIAGFDAPEPVKVAFDRDHPNASVRKVTPVTFRDGRQLIAVDYTTLTQDKERVLYDPVTGDRINPKTGK